MRMRRFGPSRWYRWGLIALVLLIAASLLVVGYNRYKAWTGPSEARRIAEATTVAGFVRTAVVNISGGENPMHADAYFIGPAPRPDPIAIVSVPTIQLYAVPPPPAPPSWEKPRTYLVAAKGKRPDGCEASVTFESDPKTTAYSSGDEGWVTLLTAEQLEGVRNGTQIFINLAVGNCGR